MSVATDYEFLQLRSVDGESAFFALMGYFFASPSVRRDCGGYPLNDGPLYRWFVVRRRGEERVLGFISIEQRSDVVRIREGYLRPEARGRGLFRELRRKVLTHVDRLEVGCTTRVPQSCAVLLQAYGFYVQTTRGSWVTLGRDAYAASSESGGKSGGPVPRVGQPAVG